MAEYFTGLTAKVFRQSLTHLGQFLIQDLSNVVYKRMEIV